MSEPKVVCPTCRTEIPLTQSLAAPLIAAARTEFEQQLARKEAEFAKREASLRRAQEDLKKAAEAIDAEVAARLELERADMAEAEAKKARLALASDLDEKVRQVADLEQILEANNAKLAAAQRAQAEVLRRQRELDDARRELDLTVERKVQESLTAVRDMARAEAEEGLKNKVAEKELQIAGMQRQIEDLRRRAEQGSQQLQGEVLEAELEVLLRTRFPSDLIEPVPKGKFGGDVLQRVRSPAGKACGTILWEAKRTKSWSDGWLVKLRKDQREANAEISVIVSTTLPKGVECFDLIDGVWVVAPRFSASLGAALRQSLIELGLARQVPDGQQTKMELVYRYLTSTQFRHRVGAIVEKFGAMQADLEREKTAMAKLWARREEQLRTVLDCTAGLYGELQGIAGSAVPDIDGLELPMIETDNRSEPAAERKT